MDVGGQFTNIVGAPPREAPSGPAPIPELIGSHEPSYTLWLAKLIKSDENAWPEFASVVAQGLCVSAPAVVRERVAAGPVWGWWCDGTAAPDILLGDAHDRGVAMLEFKSRGAKTNWPMLGTYRRATKGTDPWSSRTSADILRDTLPELDVPHDDSVCIPTGHGCGPWKAAGGGKHVPCVHQGDVYATTTDYIPQGLQVDSLREVPGIFIAPHDRAVKDWNDSLRSTDHWTITMMADVIAYWELHLPEFPARTTLIDASKRLAGLS